MKYYKFERIREGDNPIVRITYKTWWGSFVVKDVCKCGTVKGFWVFMDDDMLTHNFKPINQFNEGIDKVYIVNETL